MYCNETFIDIYLLITRSFFSIILYVTQYVDPALVFNL